MADTILMVTLQITVLCAVLGRVICFNYCDIGACPNGHTMCIYNNVIKCNGKSVRAGLTEDLKKVYLHLHNLKRQMVAQGRVKGQPKASNMMVMSWDSELEMIAQHWANQCRFGHDKCRDTKDNTYSGQNVAEFPLMLPKQNKTLLAEQIIDGFFNEYMNLPPGQKMVEQFLPNQDLKKIGHYTQMVWYNSNKLGCGSLEKEPENEYFQYVFVVCNYKPGGNVKYRAMYKIGEPCSECPEGTECSTEYPGLCASKGDSEPTDKDDSEPSGKKDVEPNYITLSFDVVFIACYVFYFYE